MPIIHPAPTGSNVVFLPRDMTRIIEQAGRIQPLPPEPHYTLKQIEDAAEAICDRRCGVRIEGVCETCPLEQMMISFR
jgi:hypothetical protein